MTDPQSWPKSPVDSPVRVLVVDDSKTMRNLISGTLGEDLAMLLAVDGIDALEKFPAFKPQIVILDLDMPRMGGQGVIEKIRNDLKDKDTYLLVLSGHEEKDLKAEALNSGANDYLTKPFHPEELKARVGVAVRQIVLNAELRGAYAKIAEEMALVASLQSQLLPVENVHIEGIEIKSLYYPSSQASGDYFDYFPMQEGRIRLVLADIAGKGARAAFLMAIIQAFFRLGKREGHSLEKTLSLINSHLMEISPSGSDFATLFAGDIDIPAKTFTFVNAGHCPGLLGNPDGVISRLDALTFPLGLLEVDFIAQTVSFEPGSRLFLYTDGMYEWELTEDKMLSLDEFLAQAEAAASQEDRFLEVLAARLKALTPRAPQFRDDQTALWVRWTQDTGALTA